jgi:ATP-dependent exoDNAse (exonuclease V) alpha subunit
MDIQGLDYNTHRDKLLMPEYGREIQKMVDYAIGLTEKSERQSCAQEIIRMMETKVPELRDNVDFEQTLWDHLYLMSHKQLDIDWPYDVTAAEKLQNKPNAIPLPQESMRMRHYGKLLEQLFERLKSMPEGEERDALVYYTANQMKRNLTTWGHGSMSDEKVADDLARYTDGIIQLDLSKMKLEKAIATEEPKTKKEKEIK